MQFKVTTAILAAIAATAVNALPVAKRTMFDVWSPRIISLDADTVWAAGPTVTVIWDTSDAPVVISDAAAITLIRLPAVEGFLKEFNSFSLLDGSPKVTVPKIPAGDDYSIALFGDSGDGSPHFRIPA
ncbi:hypothetical protein PQX77_021710 [Marasmius sp. AFHP31]|nr:hypothetical protein PQX77_021710 [Marasmius sp. AFHP31]